MGTPHRCPSVSRRRSTSAQDDQPALGHLQLGGMAIHYALRSTVHYLRFCHFEGKQLSQPLPAHRSCRAAVTPGWNIADTIY